MLKEGKLSHLIKELKQNNRKDQTKVAKKGETSGKDKPLAILMVQQWQKVAKQRITQTFSPDSVISFLPLGEEDGTEGPMIIEAEMGGHFIHRMYVDGGSSSEILYEHCFNRFRPEFRSQMVLAATPLVGFSGEIIWPLGKLSLLVKIDDEEHSTSAWMNFMVVRLPSSYNGIIGRPGNNHITEHHDYSARMHNGLKTRSTVARNRSSHRRKDSSSNSPRISGTNYSNRLYFNRRRAEGAVRFDKAPETSVKGHILANFIVERLEDDSLDTPIEDKEELLDSWILFTDGSSCIYGSEASLIITNPKEIEFTYALRFRFDATNNEIEYEALIASLWIAEQIRVKNLQANVDLRLVANQVNGTYIAKEGENKKSDALSKMASTSFAHLSKQVLVEELKEKSINEREVLAVVEEEGRTWMTPIYEYLMKEILLEEKRKARSIRRKAGSCNMHAGPRSVVAKALRSGYYWPTMYKDTRKLIRECSSFQVDIIENNKALEINLDLLEERKEQAAIQEVKSKAKMEKYYNARVHNTSFKPGDLVYRNNEASYAEDKGKLGPK
nr:reverse transcriptase domain-containing protein [Tanacetum cinerariifolium]